MKVSYEVKDGIGIVTLKDGYNALNPDLVQALDNAFYQAAKDSKSKAVILTAEGKFFCPGGDLKYIGSIPEVSRGTEVEKLANLLHGVILKMLDFPKALVTAINGPASGAGFSLTLLSDWRVMDRDAFFSTAYMAIGFTPDGGLSWLLPRFVGIGRAQLLLNSRKRLSAQEALEWGLIHRISKKENLLDEAIEDAKKLGSFPSSAVRTTRKLIWQGFDASFEKHLLTEAKTVSLMAKSEESIELISYIINPQKC